MEIKSPLPGRVLSINCQVGSKIKEGDLLLTIESMKMENEITSEVSGIVKEIKVQKGESVKLGSILLIIN